MPDAIRSFFRRYPVTAFIMTANVVTWLMIFYGSVGPISYLSSGDYLSRPWTVLTYSLVGVGRVDCFFLLIYMMWWVGSSLEGQWGSKKFAQVFTCVSLLFGVSMAVGITALLGQGVPLSGLWLPFAGIFVMWAMMNPKATVLVFFVLPIEARFLGYLDLALLYFNTGPVLGLFALVPGLLCWLYVSEWYRDFRRRRPARARSAPRPAKKSRSRAKLKVIDGGLKDLPAVDRAPPPELDNILDKINKKGIEALSELERATLDSYSAQLRGDEK